MLRKAYVAATVVLMLVVMSAALTGCPEDVTAQYQVTVQNLTPLQTYQPLIAVMHDSSVSMFREDEDASEAFIDLVEDGSLTALVTALEALDEVTDLYSTSGGLGLPSTVLDTISFVLEGEPDDVFSIAATPNLITLVENSFAGLDSVSLPDFGSRTYYMDSYFLADDPVVELSPGIQNLVRVTITRQ